MEETEKPRLIDKLRVTFRMVLMNDETFEEVGSYRLTPLNVYIVVSSVLVLFAIIVMALVVYTPLKRYIPGYGGAYATREIGVLHDKVNAMEKEIKGYKTYTENIKKALTGDVETVQDNEQPEQTKNENSKQENVERIKEDELLRKEIERNEKLSKIPTNEVAENDAVAPTSKNSNYNLKSIPLEMLYFMPPIKGEISMEFKPEIDHFGTDILAPKDTPIKSCMDGYVISSDWTLETGNTISIQHPNNLISVYKHNSALLKKSGSSVKAGEAIAIIGNTGKLTNGPHLHFELWYNGKPVDPKTYINFK